LFGRPPNIPPPPSPLPPWVCRSISLSLAQRKNNKRSLAQLICLSAFFCFFVACTRIFSSFAIDWREQVEKARARLNSVSPRPWHSLFCSPAQLLHRLFRIRHITEPPLVQFYVPPLPVHLFFLLDRHPFFLSLGRFFGAYSRARPHYHSALAGLPPAYSPPRPPACFLNHFSQARRKVSDDETRRESGEVIISVVSRRVFVQRLLPSLSPLPISFGKIAQFRPFRSQPPPHIPQKVGRSPLPVRST